MEELYFSKEQREVPLSQYKGPVLKLTKGDKEKIAVLENSIASLEIELYKLSKY